ncbi:MAG: fused MFS/spermidine synthase [Chloroflexota bacterium]
MKRYLYFTVFASGMTTLAAELSASRLLGNVFGTSNLVWAAIIGLILIYLTLGYSLGGRWADRSPSPKTMYSILAWGAFSIGVVPYIATPVLRVAANAFDGLQVGILAGAFVAVLVLFSVPITLLGMISPFAIRLSMNVASEAGKVSGSIYAVSTLGSFVGTYLPVLVFIPIIGTSKTFLVFSLFLLFVALVGLGLSSGRKVMLPYLIMVVVLAFLGIIAGNSSIKNTEGQVFEAESAYNYIQVLEKDGYTYLRLNEGQGVHSIYKSGELNYGGPWQQFLAGPFFYEDTYPEDVRRMAIIGLAAGTTARQASAVFPNVVIDGYELDPRIVQVGIEYFDMILKNLNIHIEDGRWGLTTSPYMYEIIAVDAYRPPYIPWHMTTKEFFQVVIEHLSAKGVLVINVGRAPNDRRLIDGLASTIGSVFPSVYIMDIPGTFNSMIYATRQPTQKGNLNTNMVRLAISQGVDPLLVTSIYETWGNLQPTPINSIIFTDDLAPIEWITNNMVLNYVLFGDVENIQ